MAEEGGRRSKDTIELLTRTRAGFWTGSFSGTWSRNPVPSGGRDQASGIEDGNSGSGTQLSLGGTGICWETEAGDSIISPTLYDWDKQRKCGTNKMITNIRQSRPYREESLFLII